MSKRKLRQIQKSKKPIFRAATPEEQKQFLTFYNVNDFAQAQRYAETLTQRYPKDAFGWKVLGSCLHKNGDIESAKEALEQSLKLNAEDAQTQHIMARVWYDLGEPLAALEFAEKAIKLEPNFSQGHFTFAEILTESDQDDDALEHALKAESLGYSINSCLFIRGHIYTKRRHYQKAFDTVSELLKSEPDNAFVQNEIGNLYKDLGQFDEAETAFRKALSLEPDFDTAFSNLLVCMHYNPEVSAEKIFRTIREWESHFNQEVTAFTHQPALSDATKTIRIGLVSPGFRMHPVGQMVLTGFENLQPDFELHFYSTNNADDVLTQRLKQVATRWNLVRHLDQTALAERIYQDGIDILIDLSGFGEGSRLRTMSLKPAPLIVKWVGGLINTMGLPCFDYLISDQHETPEGSDDWYTEKLIRLPNDYICYFPAQNAPTIKALPAMSNGYITLGCFNNPAKINAELLGEWAKLMNELPNSRLFLKSGQYESAEYCERIYRVMGNHGIEAERLILEGPSNHKDLLDAYNRVDIALDTWPYSGGLTTCEAFMMGVPVVTLPGPTFAGRHSATHLINAGMPELVVQSWDEYRQRVVELASDIPNLSVIRACLRQFLIQSPTCDAERFGKHFSTAMRAIWQRYCEGNSAAALTLDQQGKAYFEDSITAVEVDQPSFQNNIKADFSWPLQGKIVAIDNGARLLGNPVIEELLSKETLELVVFDPASRETKNPASSREGIHYYANNSLGDGQSTTLKATLDPAMSSLLEPLAVSTETDGRRVLARLPFNTVALDNIDGLPSLDWLVIDELSDSATILEHGQQSLKSSLLIQINVAFQPTHERQPNLDEVQRWASHNGFRFYRLHDLKHRSLMPASLNNSGQPSSELLSAQALLLPDHGRMAALDHRQATKLSFLLHTVYGLQDAACSLLAGPAEQQQYLDTVEKEAGSALMSADTQWQPMVQAMMLANRPVKPRFHGLPGDLIVSLTSYPGRFSTLWATLQSLLTQTVAPDRVVLWIAQDDREKLPENVLSLVASSGLEVHYCEDIRSYKKIVPTLKEWPEAYIATADDDIYYPPTWLEELVEATQPGKKEIAAHRIHKIQMNKELEILPYKEWEWNSTRAFDADALNFPTSGAGVLYPPNCFHKDVSNESIFKEACSDADDIWLYVMARLNGYSFKHTGRIGFVTWPSTQAETLWHKNISEGENDIKIKRLFSIYGNIHNKNASTHKSIENKIIETRDKLFDASKTNKERKISIIQKIRRQALIKKVTSENTCSEEIKKINNISKENFKHIKELFDLKLQSDMATVNFKIPSINSYSWNKAYKEKFDLIQEEVDETLFDAILHGSMADRRYTEFSDVDISLFIKNEALATEESISRVRKKISNINKIILDIDPLGHHGCFINHEFDLKNYYPEANMPLKVLAKGVNFSKKEIEVSSTPRNSLDEAFLTLSELCLFFKNLDTNNEIRSAYELKNIISRFFMINLLHYEVITNDFSDKRSILTKKINKILTKNQKKALTKASEIREIWKYRQPKHPVFISQDILTTFSKVGSEILEDVVRREITHKIEADFLINGAFK
ncbi:tetratricopeptide repeat protein [Kushneria marisflavi]|uniref:protein O-GlcNAc transferase n=1 Tax=Kushneria marisflavi TaxID=157779 RepID=A0A240USJ0_9GAMM|nr:tetratricopeptide repeat protein [Kushneria marisflavi]ART64454.1 hypothetical protein B9H00_16455 [Kushneria marisflavi]RKD86609.1 putative O-linked N-acetylglucosamine transferase (SPINDLY family) [Kushneria marisflavi]